MVGTNHCCASTIDANCHKCSPRGPVSIARDARPYREFVVLGRIRRSHRVAPNRPRVGQSATTAIVRTGRAPRPNNAILP